MVNSKSLIIKNLAPIDCEKVFAAIDYIAKARSYGHPLTLKLLFADPSRYVDTIREISNIKPDDSSYGLYIPPDQSNNRQEYLVVRIISDKDRMLSTIVHELNHYIDNHLYPDDAQIDANERDASDKAFHDYSELKSKYYQTLFLIERCNTAPEDLLKERDHYIAEPNDFRIYPYIVGIEHAIRGFVDENDIKTCSLLNSSYYEILNDLICEPDYYSCYKKYMKYYYDNWVKHLELVKT